MKSLKSQPQVARRLSKLLLKQEIEYTYSTHKQVDNGNTNHQL
jgi:hypothetical protein